MMVEWYDSWFKRKEFDGVKDQAFYECGCFTHALEITRFDTEDDTFFTLWSHHGSNATLRERIISAWKMLFHGYAIGEIVLSHEQLTRKML